MQVILLQDVTKIGRRHEIKQVADGYGRNFLLARKLAVLATPEDLQKLEQWKLKSSQENKLQGELLDKALEQLVGQTTIIKAKASPEGHLFAGIHEVDILVALEEQHHLKLPIKAIELEQAIKTVGEHLVVIKGATSAKNKTSHFILQVEAVEN